MSPLWLIPVVPGAMLLGAGLVWLTIILYFSKPWR